MADDGDDAVLKQGFLSKRALKSGRNWKRRYFVLRGGALGYSEKKGSKEKGSLTLSASTTVEVSAEAPFAFQVADPAFGLVDSEGNACALLVSADDEFDRDEWVLQLRGAAAGGAEGGAAAVARRAAFKERKRGASSFYFGTGIEAESRLRKASVEAGRTRKQGYLDKLGGGEGGKKNWKRRFVVLTADIAYYADEEAFHGGLEPKGRIGLDAFFVRTEDLDEDDGSIAFTVQAYPKSMTFRASSCAVRDDWVVSLNRPLHKLYRDGMVDTLYQLNAEELQEGQVA